MLLRGGPRAACGTRAQPGRAGRVGIVQAPARNVRVHSWREYFTEDRSAAEQFFGSDSDEDQASSSRTFESVSFNNGKLQRRAGSSWTSKERDEDPDRQGDYLSDLGAKQLYNINVDHGQNVDHIDSLFAGDVLGHKSDIADGSLRAYDFRTFNNLVGDYYVAPDFLEKVALHMAKNYLYDLGAIGGNVRVPLILGIWGEKGMGKTFQTELALKKLGAETVVMSAGELEDEWAGTPGKLIRERYRKASEMSKVRGKMSALLIHDIDAGLGHFDHVQVTVNNQIVIGTLMNICDNPNVVSTGQEWRSVSRIRRTPIIVTGNDFSKMFAPLIRDGRMDKYYWKPTREDLVQIVWQMYKEDGLSRRDIEALLDRFRRQPLDFFGALRAGVFDDQIRSWIKRDITGEDFSGEDANLSSLHKHLVANNKQGTPQFEPPRLTLDLLVEQGERLEMEQQQVMDHKLSAEYLKHVGKEQDKKAKLKAEKAGEGGAAASSEDEVREALAAVASSGGKRKRQVRQKGFGG
ncbi:hypothetical protein HYH03_008367 [Edaphochlamys debaryana]|uniref:Ribulose bisphosphate carboxylase/oxygenase activase, chloroplastic n=1 Tax=Edaphochlamys debaryana TaxID=47281 RepID=A0A835Y2M7_9CHLO|nr:hypothetical protein HYH03_008367 [Edaphochlamys debaryana]|eukprot:KAG2493553.1 hypothetical protein HYH03_008367 [Edaphochlamys debaryana]